MCDEAKGISTELAISSLIKHTTVTNDIVDYI